MNTNNKQIQKMNNSSFESIRHIDEEGREFWYARELMTILEYNKWENFEKVINLEGRNKNQEMVKISYEKLGWISEFYGQDQKAQELWEKAEHYK